VSTQAEKLREEWIRFACARENDAYKKIYRYYYIYLNFIGLKRGFSSNRVKDVINDLFLYLWENVDKLAQVTNYHNYLITSFLHRLARKEPFAADAAVELQTIADALSEPSVEAAYIQEQAQTELRGRLASYLDGLPPRQREVIYQKFYLGLSYAEIAAANQLSVNTVYNTVYQALEKLKATLGGQAGSLLGLALALAALLYWAK
jgi:RNA polymerase sigma factor (sigma-70 family)